MLLFGIVIFVDHCFTLVFLRICLETCLLNMHIFFITVIHSEFGKYFNLQTISGL